MNRLTNETKKFRKWNKWVDERRMYYEKVNDLSDRFIESKRQAEHNWA